MVTKASLLLGLLSPLTLANTCTRTFRAGRMVASQDRWYGASAGCRSNVICGDSATRFPSTKSLKPSTAAWATAFPRFLTKAVHLTISPDAERYDRQAVS